MPDGGRPVTFEEYLVARGGALVRIARLLAADDRRADRLVRDALVRAYGRWNVIVKTERPDVLLRRRLVEAQRWRRPSPPDEAGPDPMWPHIAGMPWRERAVLALRHYEDLDDAVIAEIVDCSPAAVRGHARRAVAALSVAAGEPVGPGLEGLVTASLRARAAAPVELSALLATASAQGRVRWRRARTARWATAAAVLAVVGSGLAALPRPTDPPLRFDGIGPYVFGDTRLPRAPGVPGALARPDLVGTDPGVLHFDASGLTDRARWHTWTTGPGYEKLEAAIGRNDVVYLTIGRDMSAVDAVAREESLRTVARQELAGGLWLRLEATDDRLLGEVEQALNLAESQRCVLPYRLPARPRGARVTTCYVGFRDGHYAEGGLILRAGPGRSMEVQAQYVPGFPNRKTANHQCGDRPAFLFPGGQEVEVLLGYAGLYLSARIGGSHRGFALADADALLAAVTVASNVERIGTWPPSPLSP
jgi:hypothetical protein